MIEFTRQSSGLYLSTDPASARVAFLFQDAGRIDPTFTLDADSWKSPASKGYIAFFAAAVRSDADWSAFATTIRNTFTSPSNSGSQIGWFPEAPLTLPPNLIFVSGQGTAQPMLSQTFQLKFRQSVTYLAQPDFFTTTVLFDNATNSLTINNPDQNTNVFQLSATPAGGATSTFPTTAAATYLAMTGDLTGTASCVFPLTTQNLTAFEAGMMYFTPPEGGSLVGALSYPVFRGVGGSNTPFVMNVTLDMLAPLDPVRTFFQFTDTLIGCNYVTANGKSFAFTTAKGDLATNSRLVFASRPLQSATDDKFYYLTPAGQFGFTLDGVAAKDLPATTQMLCGITGTEFLDIDLGAAPDGLLFTPAQPAWRIVTGDSATKPAYLDSTATTSYGQIVTTKGSYVSQPQGAPLYAQSSSSSAMLNGTALDSGLTVYVLNYLPLDSWVAQQKAPPTPLAPYSGIPFATNPNLKVDAFRDMESNALNPKRANAYLTQPPPPPEGLKARNTLADGAPPLAMTPQGMIAELSGNPPVWDALQMAISAADKCGGILEFKDLGPSIRKAVQQNQIFTVISTNPETTTDPISGSPPLFDFGCDELTISDWTFQLSPGGTAAPTDPPTPPIFMMKFYPGESISSLVDDTRLWSQPDTFNTTFTPDQAQAYLQKLIADATASVYPDGTDQPPDKDSLYWNFYQVVNDPTFNGILAVNCNMELDSLPTAIKAVLGGMKKPGIAGFRVHHVGVAINNTDPSQSEPTLGKSSMFALVDYEAEKSDNASVADGIEYDFEVEYLRALFTNSALNTFSCKINLTINNLFDTEVTQEQQQSSAARASEGGGDDNTIVITGSYQANSTSGDDSTSGEGIYSFVAEGTFVYNFAPNNYLKSITLTKLQFSFDQETTTGPDDKPLPPYTTRIKSRFSIWGNLAFNKLQVLDIFSFEALEFSDLGIGVEFNLVLQPDAQPSTYDLTLFFAPGNLRLDLGATENRSDGDSLLSLIPFKLKSFLYSQNADQTIESLNYYSFGDIAGLKENGIELADRFNYALIFDLDLGSMGGLVGSLSAFKFSILIGWQNQAEGGNIAFGVQLPQVDGKLEIKIQGVLTISIQQFTLLYATDTKPSMLVLGLQDCYVEVLGTRIPPGTGTISFGLFAPSSGADQIGWIAAYNKGEDGGGGGGVDGGGENVSDTRANRALMRREQADGGGGDDGGVFVLNYVGFGQRVGPDPTDPPKNFDDFLKYMQTTFWEKLKDKKFADIYHPNGRWIVVTDFVLLGVIEIGFVFYDVTPFYALQIKLIGGAGKGFAFEITYTKISDTIGLFAATFSLPDSLRTFQVGVASLTLPTLSVDIYTNGNWKVDLGFPDGDNWSVCFRVQAQAGPVPVTGSGGFYIASLSSATDPDVFKGTYQSIEAFGFAARLGVGKDFVAGPLKAGVSVTFFGIVQGAAGYLTPINNPGDIFQTPDALQIQGQFGVIGELYGSIDFVIIKASVNVRLQASIGIVISYEPHVAEGGDGSILLYIEASVSVSVSVEINLFLFSVTISFSFRASFRFEWQLLGSSANAANAQRLDGYRDKQKLLAAVAADLTGLCPGLPVSLPLLFLPELTVIFPNATDAGAPWGVVSLGIQYESAPQPNPPYSAFKPFEAMATQVSTFALMRALNLPSYDSIVLLNGTDATPGMIDIDSAPDLLTGWISYTDVLGQLGLFKGDISIPTASTQATIFAMPPFLELATKGRPDGDFSYVFESKNPVSQQYITDLDAYFNQLFVNQSAGAQAQLQGTTDATTPLPQEIFLDYFTGLIRATVHQLLVTMQNQGLTQAKLSDLFSSIAGAPTTTSQSLYQQVAGQMSSALRGGVRLPYADGLTVPPGGTLSDETNPLFALLWQQFAVGTMTAGSSYDVQLSNPDGTQDWLTVEDVPFHLTYDLVQPYMGLNESSVIQPGNPAPEPLTSTGPQSFAFQSPIVWTPPAPAAALTLNIFPTALLRLQTNQGSNAIPMVFKSRSADGPYQPDGTPLPATDVALATSINLTVAQIPAGQGAVLTEVFSLSGASQADEALLGLILDELESGARPIASIQILYQTSAGAAGLVSSTVDPTQVFVLRTNTTTVSQPPTAFAAALQDAPQAQGVAVGATSDVTADGGLGFLQIVQQATVTNASGYYLRYIATDGKSLPSALFVKGVGQVTMLVSYTAGSGGNTDASPLQVEPYENAVVLANTQSSLVYYCETAEPALEITYVKNAAGTFGVELSRSESVMKLTPSAKLMTQLSSHSPGMGIRRGDAIKALRASGVTGDDELHRELVAMGTAPASLNALYALVCYQVGKTTGFIKSNLSAPLQPQRPTDDDPTTSYRLFVPLYNLAEANQGVTTPPNRYASIGDPFTLSFFTNDAFGNQLPTPKTYSDTNYYFDAILPVDQWLGIVPTFDFGAGTSQPDTIYLGLTPSNTAFAGMSADELAAALATYQTIQTQIEGPGVSFYVETSLALAAGGTALKSFPVDQDSVDKITALVDGMVKWLQAGGTGTLPAPVRFPMQVTTDSALPPVFEISVLLGIQRLETLISPYLKDQYGVITYPSAQNVATLMTAATGGAQNMSAFAKDFTGAFNTQKLALGMNDTATAPAEQKSSTARMRKQLKSLKMASDGSGGARANSNSIWAAAASLLDISIGTAANSGPRFLSPKPLDNTLNSAMVPLPTMPAGLPQLPAQRLFVDVDLDQLNRTFFQAVDDLLTPASAAQAFEQAQSAYTVTALGRETLAQKYALYEVDWLFDAQSPFTGSPDQLTIAQEVFEQQMRAALMTAYSVDTIGQYDVTWNQAVSSAVDGYIELFGQVQAMLYGTYSWSGNTISCTTTNAHALVNGNQIFMSFAVQTGSTPTNAIYAVIVTGDNTFTISTGSTTGQGSGGFTGTRQNAGLSTAHVGIVSAGSSPLTFLYGDPDILDMDVVPFDLRYNVTNLQLFLEPPNSGDEARASLWLQLVDPYPNLPPHMGPDGKLTDIPVVVRQYPTPPTLVSQSWSNFTPEHPSGNPIADGADWSYTYTYQAFIIAQDQINTDVTYNTDLSASGGGGGNLANADPGAGPPYDLFTALARSSSVLTAIQGILQNPEDPNWAAAFTAFSASVTEVVQNTDWNPTQNFKAALGLVNVTDHYFVKDVFDNTEQTQDITVTWPDSQGQSSFANVELKLVALDPTTPMLTPYKQQTLTRTTSSVEVSVKAAPIQPGLGVAQQIVMDGLNVLAAENALAAVQIERNLISLEGPDGKSWSTVPEFVYMTPQVRPSAPTTPFIDNPTPIDVTKLPSQGTATACPSAQPSDLCQRIYTIMANLLVDPTQSQSLLEAFRAAGVADDDTTRRVKVGCSFSFPIPSATGQSYDTKSLSPLVPIVLARSFDIDGQQSGQIADFALVFAKAIDVWSLNNSIVYGSASEPAGAMLVFDITLYAALSGVDTPVLRFSNLQLKLTDIEPIQSP